jgi:hypothetical protein
MMHWFLSFLLVFGSQAFCQTECKLPKEKLRPIIQNSSPYFYRLTWDDKTKIETAQLDEESELKITQSGCDRHHTAFVFRFPLPDSSIALPEGFWPSLAFVWMDRVYDNQLGWQLYRQDFRKQLLRFYSSETGMGQTYNFPVLEKNFFYYETVNQGKVEVHVEVVRYLYNERVRRPGVEEEEYPE